MLNRFKRAYRAGRNAMDAQAASARDRPAAQRMALLVLDMPDRAVRELAERHVAAAATAGATALLVTNATGAGLYLRRDLVCEHLPSVAELALIGDNGPDLSLTYLRRRLTIILEKWAVTECLWSGDAVPELINAGSLLQESNIRFRPFT